IVEDRIGPVRCDLEKRAAAATAASVAAELGGAEEVARRIDRQARRSCPVGAVRRRAEIVQHGFAPELRARDGRELERNAVVLRAAVARGPVDIARGVKDGLAVGLNAARACSGVLAEIVEGLLAPASASLQREGIGDAAREVSAGGGEAVERGMAVIERAAGSARISESARWSASVPALGLARAERPEHGIGPLLVPGIGREAIGYAAIRGSAAPRDAVEAA